MSLILSVVVSVKESWKVTVSDCHYKGQSVGRIHVFFPQSCRHQFIDCGVYIVLHCLLYGVGDEAFIMNVQGKSIAYSGYELPTLWSRITECEDFG
jgi:hypothetical protein